MKTSRKEVWLDNNPWLRAVIDGTAYYFKATLKYIRYATIEPGEEDQITRRDYTFVIQHSGEEIKHCTVVHVFYHKRGGYGSGKETPANEHYTLFGNDNLAGVLNTLRATYYMVDAIVIQTMIHSSRAGTVSDCFEVVIPDGSKLEKK